MIRLSGRATAALIIGVQGIRSRKMRTFLSVLSLFLGILTFVAVQGIVEIAKKEITRETELQEGVDGTRVMYAGTDPIVLRTVRDLVAGRSDAVAETRLTAIIGEPRVTPVNPGGGPVDEAGPIRAEQPAPDASGGSDRVTGAAIEVTLIAVTGDVRRFIPLRPVFGQFLDFTSAPQLAPRIVINQAAAKALEVVRVPGQMRIDGAVANPTPRIVGGVDNGSPTPAAYVRLDELMNWLPLTERDTKAESMTVRMTPAAAALESTLRARLSAVTGKGRSEFAAYTVDSAERTQQLRFLRIIFSALGAIVLLIGVAGILNVGLATVGERVEELALRRAVGTPRILLAGIVLVESLLTGLLTAVAAVGTAWLIMRVVLAIYGPREPALQNLEFPWQAVVAGVVAGLTAGALGGLIPALRAARIPIATVMRA